MKLKKNQITLRQLQTTDRIALATLANNAKIRKNVRDGFPNPYTLKDADTFIELCKNVSNVVKLAIEYENQFVGMVGLVLSKHIYKKTAEVGYWIGEPFWGKGIATAAVKLLTQYAFEDLKLKRVHAGIYSYNEASKRVLEKAGYEFEGIAKSITIKNNQFVDEWRYAIINSADDDTLLIE